ncbi:hypothetical protein [Lentzea sp. CA-135723]|uniref:hypothetical protein n=1 Tax=Lentzea sp. CA-135723 TaxID=3239950 RepID=UPI003D8E5BD4
MSPTAADLQPAHQEVLAQWRAILTQAQSLSFFDRMVVARTVKARAAGLAGAEGMIAGSESLSGQAQAVASAAADRDPSPAFQRWAPGITLLAGILGWFSNEKIVPMAKEIAAWAEQAGALLGAGVAGVFLVGVPGYVIMLLFRGVGMALLSVFQGNSAPSASEKLLGQAAPAEQRVFGLLGERVPGAQMLTGSMFVWIAVTAVIVVWVLGSFVVAFFIGISDGSPGPVPPLPTTFRLPLPTT